VHPAARANVAILGVEKAKDLGKLMAAAGIAQNLAALRALATDGIYDCERLIFMLGIQKGHMRLHQRSRDKQSA